MSRAVIVMGVAGSGKTTIGRLLASRLGWEFEDADDYHPPANVAKMAQGIALRDEDRWPWLESLAALLQQRLSQGRSIVLACSALKARYRERLRGGDEQIDFVYLRGSRELILERLEAREDHYMPPALLESQLAALEEPDEAVVVDVGASPDEIVSRIESQLGLVR